MIANARTLSTSPAQTIANVLKAAVPAPISWTGGVDLRQHHAGVGLKSPEVFAATSFIQTGYCGLDSALGGGFAHGETTAMTAATSVGKTTFEVNLALNTAKYAAPTAILSLEMRSADIWRLLVGVESGVPRRRLRQQDLSDEMSARVAAAVQKLAALPLYVLDRRAVPSDAKHPEAPTMQALTKIVEDGVRHCGWKIIFLDYLTKIGPFDAEELVRIPRLTNWVADLAQRTGVHVVALVQNNKSAYGRRDNKTKKRTIGLEDAKGTIEVVADFDNVIGLVRDDWNSEAPKDPSPMRAVVLKARQGPGDTVPLTFHRRTGVILEGASLGEPAPGPAAASADAAPVVSVPS